MKRSSVLLIRRFAAVILTIFSVICLFWPAMISLTDEDMRELCEEIVKYEEKHKDEAKESHKKNLEKYKEAYGKKDGKKYLDAEERHDDVDILPDKSFLNLRTLETTQWTMNKIVEKNEEEEEDYPSYYTDKEIEELEEEKEERETERTKTVVYSLILNVLFFAMLASGVAATVLYFLNNTKIAGLVHAILTVLGVATVIALLIRYNHPYVEDGDDAIWGPGVGLFLMPIFSIGALFLYQRDKKCKGLFPKAAPRPAYAAAPTGAPYGAAPTVGNPFADRAAAPEPRYAEPAAPEFAPNSYAAPEPPARPAYAPRAEARSPYAAPEAPNAADKNLWSRPAGRAAAENWGSAPAERPVSRPAAPEPVAEGWVCEQCATNNPADAMFCSACGTPKPAPRAAAERPAFCPNCGEKLDPDSRFCINCGAKLF